MVPLPYFLTIASEEPLTLIIHCVTVTILIVFSILLYHVLNPTVLKHPWPTQYKDKGGHWDSDRDTSVVFAGSFNPPHNGHLVMIKYLARRYKEVHLVIGVNRKKTYKVSPMERADILKKMVGTLGLQDGRVRVGGETKKVDMSNQSYVFKRLFSSS